ncbi:MAG: cupredoxin domain-containing protein [bacterium]
MLRKFLASTLSFAAFLTFAASSNAAEIYKTIDITSRGYPYIDFYPRSIHLNKNDTLHLTIKNTKEGCTRLFIPSLKFNQKIPKNSAAQLDLCIANPIDKVMWFQISSLDADKIPGYLIVDNYQAPMANVKSKAIDVSALDNIINYSTEFSSPEKEEPMYRKTPQHIRGYW